MMDIQVFSDIHGEAYCNQNFIWNHVKPQARVAVVAGDIHSKKLESQLNEIASRFNHVVCVLGNHEFYGRDIDWRPDPKKLRKNVHLLDRGVWQYYNTVFIGVTLWTDFKNQDFFVMHMADSHINDFYAVSTNNGGTKFSPKMAYELHRHDRAYLKMMIEKFRAEKKRIVVVTHFMPSYDLVDAKWKGNPGTDTLNWYFSAQCDDLMDMDGISAWICGHSHDESYRVINGCQFVRNPLGYPRERDRNGHPYKDVIVPL